MTKIITTSEGVAYEELPDGTVLPCRKGSAPKEKVNHPSHYQGLECIEAMEYAFGTRFTRDFCRANTFKYRCRAGKKDGEDAERDLAKAKWYEDYAVMLNGKVQQGLELLEINNRIVF